MTNTSLQLYTIRFELEKDAEATLSRLAAAGFTEVEPFGITQFREWLPAALNKHGLKVTSAHTSVIDDFDNSVAAIKELGGTIMFQPFWDPEEWKTREGVDNLVAKLNEAAEKAKEHGLKVGYHNHHFEFLSEIDGAPAYDYFVSQISDDIVLEIDTYWVAIAGVDPVALLEKLGDRVTHLHIKDGPLDPADDHAANLVLGQGKMDLPALLDATGDKTWVIEFDASEGDIMDDVEASLAYIQAR